jgi:hypothetical protein
MKMFNKLLERKNYSTIKAGIGLGCDQELIVKAGQSGSGINDKIWIGKAVVDACHLGNIANRSGILPIAMSTVFYDNIEEILNKENERYRDWVKPHKTYYSVDYYHCDIVETEFNEWIEEEL